MYGQKVQLTIGYSSSSQTLLGGIVTIIGLVFIIIFFLVQLFDLLKHETPNVSFIEITDKTYGNFSFGSNFLNMGFKTLAGESFSYLINIKPYLITESEDKISKEEMKVRTCKASDFPNIQEKNFDFSVYRCLDLSEEEELKIYQSDTENIKRYIQFYFELNETFQISDIGTYEEGLEQSKIYQFIRNVRELCQVEVIVRQVSIDPYNFKEAKKYYLEKYYFGLTGFGDEVAMTNFYLKNTIIETDSGFIFSDISKENSLTIEKYTFEKRDLMKYTKNIEFGGLSAINVCFYLGDPIIYEEEYFMEILMVFGDTFNMATVDPYVMSFLNENNTYCAYHMDQNELAIVEVRAGDKTNLIKRSYPKVQDILATTGGIFSVISTVSPFIAYIFSVIRMKEHILNKIFQFDFTEQKNKPGVVIYIDNTINENIQTTENIGEENIKNKGEEEDNNKKERIKYSKRRKNPKINDLKSKNKNSDKHKRKEITSVNNDENISPKIKEEENQSSNKVTENINTEVIKEENNNFNYQLSEEDKIKYKYILNSKEGDKLFFSTCEIIKMFACPCECCQSKNSKYGIKLQLYEKSKNLARDYFEITFIVKLLNHLEKLKYVMLTREQLSLLRFISDNICTINISDNNKLSNLEQEFSDYDKMALNCMEYKKKIEERARAATAVDIRLLELLDKRFIVQK